MSRVTVASVANKNLFCFFDDFTEPCTAVNVKKITGTRTPFFYTLLISVLLLLGSNHSTSFKIYFCQRVKKKRFWGLLPTWRPLFTFL